MKCKLCGRKITAKLSKKRGYGPVCWEKVEQDKQPTNNQYEEKIAKLESIVSSLIVRVNSLSRETPNSAHTTPTQTAIPVYAPDISISELTSNPLFLKMQQICVEA